MDEIDKFAEIFDDRRTYKLTLEHFLKDYNLPQNPTILNVGCGQCREGKVITDYFRSEMIGIDINEDEIEKAKLNNPENHFKFITGDAKELTKYVNNQADIIIARHPNPFEDWKQIYKQCYKLTKPNGIIITSLHMNLEQQDIYSMIKKAGYKIQLQEENPHAFFVSRRKLIQSAFCDGYITIGIKDEIGTVEKLKRKLF